MWLNLEEYIMQIILKITIALNMSTTSYISASLNLNLCQKFYMIMYIHCIMSMYSSHMAHDKEHVRAGQTDSKIHVYLSPWLIIIIVRYVSSWHKCIYLYNSVCAIQCAKQIPLCCANKVIIIIIISHSAMQSLAMRHPGVA